MKWTGPRSPSTVRWTAIALIVLVTGCKKEDLSSLVDQAKKKAAEGAEQIKQQVAGATQQAQEQLNLAGSIELTLDAPLTTSACYATLVPATAGRPALFQLRSYPSAEKETAPSVFAQAQVTATAWSELAGQTLPARIWVQSDTSGTIWSSDDGSLEIKVTSVDDKGLAAELAGGKLRNAATGAELPAAGKFVAVFASAGN